ncbi:MAG: hypothetical protein CXZ00_16775 [Acidobacteria bacterium]|nr:MAG: hypothetical protein CXZ00_16775 [Acidobacteriota bacterium]
MEEKQSLSSGTENLPKRFWIYLCGAALVAAGFADFQLIAFHLTKTNAVSAIWVPISDSIAMPISGAGSLLFGRLFDRFGLQILIPLTFTTAAFAPLVFLGSFWAIIVGSALWALAWEYTNRLSRLPSRLSCLPNAARRHTESSLVSMVSHGSWEASLWVYL